MRALLILAVFAGCAWLTIKFASAMHDRWATASRVADEFPESYRRMEAQIKAEVGDAW